MPAAKECGLHCSRAEEEPHTEVVFDKVKRMIADSHVCVADLSGQNANVMIEVAVALSHGKPVVFITRGRLTDIPFDIRHHRVIKYANHDHGFRKLKEDVAETVRATLKLGGSPTEFLRKMLVPSSLSLEQGPYVVAASPLSYREAFRIGGGWLNRPIGTFSDHIGIRGLMQAFGLIYGLDRLPDLLDPNDFDDKVLSTPMHLYCIGSPKANRWTGLMMKNFFENCKPAWEFRPDPDSTNLRNPKVTIYREGKPYEPVHSVPGGRLVWDYGLVIRGPHPQEAGRLLMILAGRSYIGNEAACLAATSPACVEKLVVALTAENVDLDDHSKRFCAVVSVAAKERKSRFASDPNEFRVEGVRAY